MRSVLFLFLLCGTISLPAQNTITDSLWNRFNQLPFDSTSVDTMISGVLKMRHAIKKSPEEERMLQSALAMAQRLKYRHGMAEAYNLLGVYYRDVSRYGEAISFHEKALEIGKETKDSVIIGYALNSMGVAYRRLDDNEKAFQYHFEALGISKATNNLRGRTIAMNSIANIYLSMGEYKNAIEEFEQCLELERQLGSNIGQAINYANLGAAYEGLGELDKAISLYLESLRYNTLENSEKGIAICHNLLGEAYLKKGEYNVALSHLQKALALNDRLRDRINAAENYITIGNIYQKKEDSKTALQYLNRGLEIAERIGSPSLVIKAYESIGETEIITGSPASGYRSLRRAYDLKDSLFKEQATPQLAKLRTLYELDKKEDQIKLLQQENEISQLKLDNRTYLIIAAIILFGLFLAAAFFYLHYRRQKDHQLKVEYELQSLRSQMNPHFIFNALNSIDNFIWKKDPEVASSYLVKFSSLMRMTLQNSRLKSIPLAVELEFLELYLELENFRHSERFQYEIFVDPDIDTQNAMIPSMVIQPFVENAILHGLSHKLEGDCLLSIRFNKQNDLIICEVEDNGIGRQQAKVIQETTAVGKQSVGIQVTEERVNLLKKITGNKNLKIQITDLINGHQEGSGTHVKIILPLEHTAGL